MVVVDEAEFGRLPGTIAMYRAALAAPGAATSPRRWLMRAAVLDLVADDDHLGRGAAAALLGLAYWSTGDLDAAYRWYADGQASLEKAGHLSDVVGGAITLADIRIAEGRLRDAMRLYERGLQVATAQGGPALRGAADMHVGMSELFRERNDLERASQHLLASRELGEENGLPQNRLPVARRGGTRSDRRGATWMARSSCSTRLRACTPATSLPTSAPLRL